jgi:uncharacterized protein (TIGR03083 family)
MDWSWVGPPLDARSLFPLERAEFMALLRGLDADDWQRPTVCPGWRVHDIVAHVVHDHIRRLSRTRDQYAAPDPAQAWIMPGSLHRSNQEFVDAARPWSPRVLTGLLGHLGSELDHLWASMKLDQLGEPVSWAAPGLPAPAWLDIAREYTEYWVHQQQIRDAVGRPGADSKQLMTPVIDTFQRAVPHTLRDLAPADGTCVQIQVTGTGGGDWTAQRRNTIWTMDRGPATRPVALIQLSSGDFWRVATRGITVETARERALISGDPALGAAVLNLVAIIR